LVGGGCLLRGFAERMRVETHLPIYLADSPLTCVAIGAGQSLEELSVIQRAGQTRKVSGRRRRWSR
jgi:rod shape-determining protein MreB and related proteins